MANETTVFIVDDDRTLRSALEFVLGFVGQKCRTFASVQELLADWRPNAAGCLLLDVRMPGTNGLEFRPQITRCGNEIPIIMMTG